MLQFTWGWLVLECCFDLLDVSRNWGLAAGHQWKKLNQDPVFPSLSAQEKLAPDCWQGKQRSHKSDSKLEVLECKNIPNPPTICWIITLMFTGLVFFLIDTVLDLKKFLDSSKFPAPRLHCHLVRRFWVFLWLYPGVKVFGCPTYQCPGLRKTKLWFQRCCLWTSLAGISSLFNSRSHRTAHCTDGKFHSITVTPEQSLHWKLPALDEYGLEILLMFNNKLLVASVKHALWSAHYWSRRHTSAAAIQNATNQWWHLVKSKKDLGFPPGPPWIEKNAKSPPWPIYFFQGDTACHCIPVLLRLHLSICLTKGWRRA